MFKRYVASRERMTQDLGNARLLLGQRLSVLLHDPYYFNDEKCPEDIGSLVWRFGEHQTVSMYLLADGESVGADQSDLPPPPRPSSLKPLAPVRGVEKICFAAYPPALLKERSSLRLKELSTKDGTRRLAL